MTPPAAVYLGLLALFPHFGLAAPTGHATSIERAAPMCYDPNISWDEKHEASCPICAMDDLPPELVTKWCGPIMNPAWAYEQADRVYRRAYQMGYEKHQMSRIETGIFKPDNGIFARAEDFEAAGTYVDSSVKSLLPISSPRPYYPRPYAIDGDHLIDGHTVEPSSFVKPTPVIDPLPNLIPLPTDSNDGGMHIYERRGIHNNARMADGPFDVTPTDETLIPPMAIDASDDQTGQPLIMPGPNQVVDNNILVSVTHLPGHGIYHRDVEGPVATQQPSDTLETDKLLAQSVAAHEGDLLPVIQVHRPATDNFRRRQREQPAQSEHVNFAMLDETLSSEPSETLSEFGPSQTTEPTIAMVEDKYTHKPAPTLWRRNKDEQPHTFPAPQDSTDEVGVYSPGVADSVTHARVDELWRRETHLSNEDNDALTQGWRHHMGHGPVVTSEPSGDIALPAIGLGPGPVIPDAVESYPTMKRSPVSPPEFFEDASRLLKPAHPAEASATPAPDNVEWSAYETPLIIDSTVKHMPILPRQPEDDSEDYGTVNGVPLSEYSRNTPAIVMPAASKVYKRQFQSYGADPETIARPIENTDGLSIRGDPTSLASAPRRTDNIRHTVLPVVSRVYRRATAFKDRLKASSSKATTVFSTIATPISAATPSPTQKPIVNFSKDQQHTGGDVPIDPSKAEVHGSANRVFDDPTLNSRNADDDGIQLTTTSHASKVYRRTPLLRSNPLPSKAATTLSTVARHTSTQATTIPSPTRTPMVDIHTLPHESTKPPPVIGTGATTHTSVTRVYDNPPLNERSKRGERTPSLSVGGEGVDGGDGLLVNCESRKNDRGYLRS